MATKHEERIKYAVEELIGKGNLNAIAEIFTTDYVAHAVGKAHKGHDFVKRWAKQLRSAIPDISVVNVQFHVQDNNTVVWQRTLSGTHCTDMMGIPPTNQKVKWNEMIVSRFEGEKIAQEWVVSELAGELLCKSPRM